MRHVTRLVLASLLLIGPAAGVASAVTARDLVELARAGLGDDVLIALLQSDQSVFRLTAPDVVSLRRSGLSERVIIAMIQTAKSPAIEPEPAVAPPATPLVSDEPPAVGASDDVPRRVVETRSVETVVEPKVQIVYAPVYVVRNAGPAKSSPASAPAAYWGFGGRARPGSWQPPDSPSSNKKPGGH